MSLAPLPRPVLYVHHRGEPSGASGALALLLERLDRERFEPHVYCPTGLVEECFHAAGAQVHTGQVAAFTHVWASTYRGRRWLVAAGETARLPPHLRSLSRLLRRGGFALVHANDSPLVAAAWLARRARLPLVWHLRSALPPEDHGIRTRALRQAVSRLATSTVAINADVAASFSVGAEVIHDSVDLDRFRPGSRREARMALAVPLDRPVVAYVGYLYPAKGFRELLHAAARVRGHGVEATWVLAGGAVRGGAYLESPRGRMLRTLGLAADFDREARELAASLELGDVVRFLPRVPDPAPVYAASDLVVHPSCGPEVGLPAIEAAASGIPAVVTGTETGGGVVLPGRTGVVAGAGEEALADAVARLLADPARARALGQAARRYALEQFDPAANARRVERVYERVLTLENRDGPRQNV